MHRDVQFYAGSKDDSTIHTFADFSWHLTSHPPPSSSVFRVFSKFLSSVTFHLPSRKSFMNIGFNNCGVESRTSHPHPSLTPTLPSPPPFPRLAATDSRFQKPKLGILSLPSTFIFTFPSAHVYKSFGERIKARMRGDEWFNLDSNCIKWANRNSWQKLYDGEVITCRLLPYCRRWEWSAGLVYRSNCVSQCREQETDTGGQTPVDFNT